MNVLNALTYYSYKANCKKYKLKNIYINIPGIIKKKISLQL
jgi:hypothetical protein